MYFNKTNITVKDGGRRYTSFEPAYFSTAVMCTFFLLWWSLPNRLYE